MVARLTWSNDAILRGAGTGGRLGAVVDRSVRDVERVSSDVPIAGDPGVSQPSPGPAAPRATRMKHRKYGFAAGRLLKRTWIPIVIIAVVAAGGLTVGRLHGIFGSERRPAYADTKVNDNKPFDAKRITYEVFGPPGTVADIGYFDVDANPQRVEGAQLPWKLVLTTTKPTIVGNLVAQGNTDSIGCRILIGNEVKAEKVTNEVSAFTFCMLKSG
jgi:hypothetical protein